MATNRLNMLKSVQMPSTSSDKKNIDTPQIRTIPREDPKASIPAEQPKRGRPAKPDKGVNATFALDPQLIRDLKLIAANEGRPQKQLVAEILTDFVAQYKSTHMITLG